nr:MAG TPA: Large polyvalent protein-associated domain 3 [Caudoviricetes sp.]
MTVPHTLTFDASPSARSTDENGFLHVASSHITKATVNPYYGREIPGWREAGLDPEAVYYGFRDPEELKKSLSTWQGLPLHIEHHVDSAEEPARLTRVGAVGRADWNAPYVDAPLTVWDGEAIAAIEDGSFRELSCAYRYDPDFRPGRYEGVEYDFIMRNIRGNHVALVEEGRAGPDVVVADGALDARDTAFEGSKHPRDKSGRFGKGRGESSGERGVSSGTEISLTGNELGSYRDVKELRQKAVDYYKEHLQGKPAHRDDIGEIRFTRKGMEKSRSFSGNPDKLLMFPAIRDIIETGKLGREEAIDHSRNDDIVAFIPISSTVNFKGKPREVELLLGKDRNGNLYYDLFLEKRQKKESPASGVGNKPTVGGDSTGFQPAVDLNIAIKPVRVNPQPDADTTRNPKLIQGAFMGKLKRWFRGAQDDNPEIEKQEVELAQAIIDLHKVDPITGEIVDITEDEDKAEEIRRLIGELSAKLDPEEVKKLTDSLTDLACSRATGDERKADAMDEEMKKAMDKCGLDAEDPTASQAFAEGVKYGEELERNPEERRRLGREHESEGMKKAMDACGLDAENPAESRAFAEGVKYGEELIRNPEERRKLDREHEAAGMKKAMGKDEDKNAAITRILDDVPDLTPEQRKRLFDSLQDLAYSPATGDADPSEVKTAQDRAFRSPRHLTAMDAARIKASAIAEAQDHMRGLHQAVRDVRGLVGDLDPLSFDSASDVYGYALKQSGIDPRRYPRQAWRGMIDMLRAGKTAALSGGMARDAAPARLDGKFAGLNNISLAD